MGLMASGAQFVKGTFTAPNNVDSYTINFGKTLSKYLYYIEMTDESKTVLHNSGQTSAKMYACYGIYPATVFNGSSINNYYMSHRVVPSSGELNVSSNAILKAVDGSSVTIGLAAITGGANNLYKDYTYNYYIVEIK